MSTPMKKPAPENLRILLEELGFKTPPEDVTEEQLPFIQEFLATERKLRFDFRIRRLLSGCGIKPHQVRTFDSFNWSFNPKLPKNDILAFRHERWVEEARNVVFIGDAGVGKSHLAKALCYDAIHRGENACFVSAFDLIGKLKKSLNPETKVSYFGSNIKVLCIDELGYTQQNKDAGDLLFQIIAKRSESLPTIITTNLPPKQWGSIFAGPAATAILDRLNYNGRFITMEGPSYRMSTKKK
jgi:DNA replication protein DnaC